MSTGQTNSTVGEIIRKQENDYIRGSARISEHVDFNMSDTINKIIAYLNSKFTSSQTDSLGRDKPFFNIVVAAANIWFRATDIDRRNIRIRATKSKDYIDSYLATIHVQDWMKRVNFGAFLNEWGRTLSRFGSAIVEFAEVDGELKIFVWRWNRTIVDAVDFDANPKIKILELTEAQLRDNENYDQAQVDALIAAKAARETKEKNKKDNKADYYKVYEMHARLPLSVYKETKGEVPNEGDAKIFVEQMHVVSFIGGKSNGRGKRQDMTDFYLFSARKTRQTQVITHLIEEDERTLSIGAVEHLFEPQWMQNHTIKAMKDQLDLASILIFQTADQSFVGQNVLTSIQNGDIVIHSQNNPLTQLNNVSHDVSAVREFGSLWKTQGNEIVGISEAMLGATPKSGTAWRQTEALLSESHNLFEIMTENKGHALEMMFREFIIPHIKKKMDTADEVAATLEAHDINKIDARYIKNVSAKLVDKKIKQMTIEGQIPTPEQEAVLMANTQSEIQSALEGLGNERFFSPSDISDKTWKEQFKDMEWNLEIDITGEQRNVQEMMTTLATALKVVMDPNYSQNKQAQAVVGRILEMSGAMSPVELSQMNAMQIESPQLPQPNETPMQLPEQQVAERSNQ